MKYKGFIISPVYAIGSDMRELACGRIVGRKPTSKDIEYYEILDPMEDMSRWIAEKTIPECKETIDSFLAKVGMKDNTKASWDLLES